MADHIDIYVGKKNIHYPDKNFWKQPKGDTLEKEFHSQVEVDAFRLASALVATQFTLIEMMHDIMHKVFRLGKLGGLKGEAWQAYCDQIGEACREYKVALFHPLITIGMFENDIPNVVTPVCTQQAEETIRFMRPETFIDFDGSAPCTSDGKNKEGKLIRPLFHFNSKYMVGECNPDYEKRMNLMDVFGILMAQGCGSLLDKIIETGLFAFGGSRTSIKDEGDILPYNPVFRDKGEIFITKVWEIMFECVVSVIHSWVHHRLLVACPDCSGEEGKQVILYPDGFSYHVPSACPLCNNQGIVFTDKVKTTADYADNRMTGGKIIDFNIMIPQDDTHRPL